MNKHYIYVRNFIPMKLLLLCSLFLSMNLTAQIQLERTVFASAGSEMSNSDLQFSFTLGEPLTSTFDSGTILTSGFQQGDLSFLAVQDFGKDEVLSLYPNPADQFLIFTNSSNSSFSYKIYDITGRIISDGKSDNGYLKLDVHSIVEGKYFMEYIPVSGQSHYLSFITIH